MQLVCIRQPNVKSRKEKRKVKYFHQQPLYYSITAKYPASLCYRKVISCGEQVVDALKISSSRTGLSYLTSVWLCKSQTAMFPSLQQEKQTLESGLMASA